jgi:hypothetical protein
MAVLRKGSNVLIMPILGLGTLSEHSLTNCDQLRHAQVWRPLSSNTIGQMVHGHGKPNVHTHVLTAERLGLSRIY